MAIVFPTSPSLGDTYLDPTSGRYYIFGPTTNRWRNYGGRTRSALTKPLDPENGEIYFNPSTKGTEIYQSSTTSWIALAGSGSTGLTDVLYGQTPYLLQSPTTYVNQGGLGISSPVATNSNVVSSAITNPFGGSSYFDFSSTAGTLGSSLILTSSGERLFLEQEFCLEMWVYPTQQTSRQGLFFFGNEASNNYRFQASIPANSLTPQFFTQEVSSSFTITSNVAFTASTWNHIAFTKLNTAVLLFVNGDLTGMQENVNLNFAVWGENTTKLWIGNCRAGGVFTHNFVGNMEDIRWTNYARRQSPFQVPTNYSPTQAP